MASFLSKCFSTTSTGRRDRQVLRPEQHVPARHLGRSNSWSAGSTSSPSHDEDVQWTGSISAPVKVPPGWDPTRHASYEVRKSGRSPHGDHLYHLDYLPLRGEVVLSSSQNRSSPRNHGRGYKSLDLSYTGAQTHVTSEASKSSRASRASEVSEAAEAMVPVLGQSPDPPHRLQNVSVDLEVWYPQEKLSPPPAGSEVYRDTILIPSDSEDDMPRPRPQRRSRPIRLSSSPLSTTGTAGSFRAQEEEFPLYQPSASGPSSLPTGPEDENKGPAEDGANNNAGGSVSDDNGGQDPSQGGGNPPSREPTPVPDPVVREGAADPGDLGPNRVRADPRLLSCRSREALLAKAHAAQVELVSRHWALSQQRLINEVDMLTVDVLPTPAVDILAEQESLQIRYKRLHSAMDTEEADYKYLAGDNMVPVPRPKKRARW
ncbi:MAG: hypothetical protein J3Q66DRAFT_401329 [Benniella sp.]|nr:MAG: hypothetical protein J3Q66DRAFT_401329 [Benniella sp.]